MDKTHYIIGLVILFLLSCRNSQNHNNGNVQTDSLVAPIDSPSYAPNDSILRLAPEIPLDSIAENNWGNWAVFKTNRSVDEKYIQTIDTNCAIIFYPSPVQMEEYYSSLDTTKPDEGSMDDMYYRYENEQILDSLHIKIVVAEKRFLRLKGKEVWLLDTHKKNFYFSTLLLFAVDKDPQIGDLLLNEDSVAEYYGIKTNMSAP